MTNSGEIPVRNGKTNMIYDMENAVIYGINFLQNVRKKMDIFTDKNGPAIIIKSDVYKNNYIEAKKRGAKIRFLTEITPENIQYCKQLREIVDEFRHLDGLKGSLCISDSEFIGWTSWAETQLLNALIHSNDKEVIEQQQYIFEKFWINAEPFIQKIRQIEEGIIPEFMETINNPLDTQKKVFDLIRAAEHEILVIMSTSNAFHRQAESGSFRILKDIVENKSAITIKILTPKDDKIEKIVSTLIDSKFTVRFIEPLSKVSILIVDRKYSLVAENKDDIKKDVTDAIGFVTYSNSSPTVVSYAAIFDSLWKQTEMFEQLKDAHEKLKVHDNMQKEFINVVAHELRTPLTPIIGLTEYVRDQTKDTKHKELLDRVVKDAKKLHIMNEKILDVTKFESKLYKPNKKRFSLNLMILDIIKNLESFWDNIKNIKFEYHFDAEYFVYADKARVAQVVTNLLDNSIKSILEQRTRRKKGEENEQGVKGVISITIEKKNDFSSKIPNVFNTLDDHHLEERVIISIKDTGKGIDKEIFPRLFTKFTSKSFQGTGLGLYISKKIVEAHGGKIWAENNKDESGAKFCFVLSMNNNKQ